MTHLDEILTIRGQNVYTRDNCKLGKWLNDQNVEGDYAAWYVSDYIALKPNTKYHIKFKMTSSSTARRFFFYTADKSHYRLVKKQSSEWAVGIIEFDVTTRSDEVWMRWSSLQGDTNESAAPDTDFKSIGNIWQRAISTESVKGATTVINNSRKVANLFDKPTMTVAARVESDGKLVPSGAYYPQSLLIPVKPNTTYTITFDRDPSDTNPVGRLNYYATLPELNVTVGTVAMTDSISPVTFTTNSDTHYIAYWLSRSTEAIVNKELASVMVNEGSTALPYYPYFSPTKVLPSLKAFGGTVQEIAPKLWGRYKPVEYITNSESAGASASYIDTGLVLESGDDIEITFQSNYQTAASPWIFGSRQTVTKGYALNTQSDLVVVSYGGNNTINNVVLKDQAKHTVTVSSGIWKVDGVQFLNKSDMTFTGDGNCLLFGMTNVGGAIESRAFTGNIFGFKAWHNGTLVRNFIPVKDTVDNVYGMWDTVTEKFYGNSGTGAFTAGPEIKRVDYIQASGTQWLNTEIYLNGDGHKAEVEYDFDSSVEAANKTLFGAQSSQNLMTLYSGSGYACGDSTIGTAGRVTGTVYTPGHHTVSFEMANNKAIYILDNGTPKEVTISASTFADERLQNSYQVSLCANNNGGNHTQTYEGKIYKFKFWKQGNLVRHFIPILLGTEYAMLDLVEWKIYRNAGTGAFTGGTVIPDRLLNPYTLKSNLGNIRYGYDDGAVIPSEYERVDYIEGTGDQHIDTGVIPDADIGAKIRMAGTVYTSGANKPIIGATVSDLRSSGVFDIEMWGSGIYFGFGTWNATTHKLVTTNVANDIYNLELNYLNSGYFKKDSESKAIPSYSDEFVNSSIYLFALNRYGSASSSNLPAKIYSAQFSKGTTIIRNFIPVKKKSNSEYGMYDTVTKQFFGNSGTGAFTGGSVISRKLITDGAHKLYLGSQGVIDLGSLTWTYRGSSIAYVFSATINDLDYSNRTFYAYSPDFENGGCIGGVSSAVNNKTIYRYNTNNQIYIRLEGYTDVNSFKSYLSGKYLYYRREDDTSFVQPTTLNITDLLPSATSYFDEQTGTLYKDWAIKVFDGTESWSRHGTNPVFILTDTTLEAVADTPASQCNYFECLEPQRGVTQIADGQIKIGYWNGSSTVSTIYVRDNRYEEIDPWKAHLKELYDEGNPLICVHPLATPTTETKTVTPISLAVKGAKTIVSAAEIPVTAQALYLGKG